jgi:DNA-binding NtrC family response regulator
MIFRPIAPRNCRARTPNPAGRVVVVTDDPSFWLGLRREGTELVGGTWVLAQSARECLVAVENPRVRLVVLDGAFLDKPANQLLHLIKQIRPQLSVVFAAQTANEEWERQAREAGVLYYADRAQLGDMARVIRQSVHGNSRTPQRRGSPGSGGHRV